jgi:hypothetical protein
MPKPRNNKRGILEPFSNGLAILEKGWQIPLS